MTVEDEKVAEHGERKERGRVSGQEKREGIGDRPYHYTTIHAGPFDNVCFASSDVLLFLQVIGFAFTRESVYGKGEGKRGWG